LNRIFKYKISFDLSLSNLFELLRTSWEVAHPILSKQFYTRFTEEIMLVRLSVHVSLGVSPN